MNAQEYNQITEDGTITTAAQRRDSLQGKSKEIHRGLKVWTIDEMFGDRTPAEPDTMQAKTLTMAFQCVPPEQLTEDLVRRTLYRLRYDLAKPKEWKPVRRYEYISWGRKKE